MSGPLTVTASTDWTATRHRWSHAATPITCGPFQTLSWLDAWYSSYVNGVEPLLVEVTQGRELAVRLPFVITQRGAQRVLEFADLGVSDFNAPLLGSAAPKVAAEATALWRAVVAALPAIDLIDLRKMPLGIAGRANPLALLDGLATSPMTGHRLDIADWTAYHTGLDRRVRMEFERCWRVFQRHRDAQFVRVTDGTEAHRILDVMDQQQRARLTEVGLGFHLDQPIEAALYRHNIAARVASGDVIITALTVGEEVVAALYAVSDGPMPTVVRISNAGGAWTNVSPGRLIVHRTLHHLAGAGLRQFELSIGDYDYKRRFGPSKIPLVDLVYATSWRGHRSALRHRAVASLRRHPNLEARLRRWLGKPDPATGRVPESKKGGA